MGIHWGSWKASWKVQSWVLQKETSWEIHWGHCLGCCWVLLMAQSWVHWRDLQKERS